MQSATMANQLAAIPAGYPQSPIAKWMITLPNGTQYLFVNEEQARAEAARRGVTVEVFPPVVQADASPESE